MKKNYFKLYFYGRKWEFVIGKYINPRQWKVVSCSNGDIEYIFRVGNLYKVPQDKLEKIMHTTNIKWLTKDEVRMEIL